MFRVIFWNRAPPDCCWVGRSGWVLTKNSNILQWDSTSCPFNLTFKEHILYIWEFYWIYTRCMSSIISSLICYVKRAFFVLPFHLFYSTSAHTVSDCLQQKQQEQVSSFCRLPEIRLQSLDSCQPFYGQEWTKTWRLTFFLQRNGNVKVI